MSVSKSLYSFPKAEKLCGDKLVEELFEKGSSFTRFPLRVTYLLKDVSDVSSVACRMMVSVGKKRFKRAVWRNRVKRQVREAYRLRKYALVDSMETSQTGKQLLVAFVFVGKDLPQSTDIGKSVAGAIERLSSIVMSDGGTNLQNHDK